MGLAAKWAGVERIVFRRGIPKAISNNVWNRYFIRHVMTDFLTNSQHSLSVFEDRFPSIAQKNPTVIYNGTDMKRWETVRHQPNPFQLCCIARFSYEKGVDLAIEAFAALWKREPRARLRLVGDGKERQKLEALVEKLGMKEAVEWIGFVEDTRPYLIDCQLLICCSRWEGFGNVLIEAMAMGIACVAYRLPAFEEIIEEGQTGILVEWGNAEAMAEQLYHLIHTPTEALRLGKAAKERVREHFSSKRMAHSLRTFLE